ncbi:MAG: helix-turn-helix domain-containing protein [Eubacterium sp.]|nr:helix-turn-helix domain-containing protein [Eubacterium sp.]
MSKILLAIEIDDGENVEDVLKKINGTMITDCNAECGNKFSDAETMLTAEDIMEYLGVGKTTVYELFNRNDFPSIRINRSHLIRKDLFLKFINEHYSKYKKKFIK